jgi:superfamily II DNA or RNA helicase
MLEREIQYTTFKSKIIYIFSIPDLAHEGRLKIGETTFEGTLEDKESMDTAARQRIDQYTKTADVPYKLLHTEIAVDNKGKSFRDYDVHQVLIRSGISSKYEREDTKRGEWFVVDLETAMKAISAVKEGRDALGTTEISQGQTPVIFRPEQEQAIKQTLALIKKKKKRMLWNAKMRFGKTLTSLEVAKQAGFEKTIIITHRPVVSEGWYEDFGKIFYNTDYTFGSKTKGANIHSLIKCNKPFVYFASMQDLRGSNQVGGGFDKNSEVFSIDWDYVIVDEAHEGNKTELAQSVHNHIKRKFTLALSGTPFNLMEDFEDEEDVYTWDYVMEQKAKMDWEKEHLGDPNPYESLPALSMFTYRLDKEFKARKFIDLEDKAFNFREFFRTYDNEHPRAKERGKFVHEEDVWKFLNLITRRDDFSANLTNFPFSSDSFRDNLKNTLWLLPGVKEAKALSELMNRHDVFSQFKIVNVAGDGDTEEVNKDAYKKVMEAIGEHPEESYTITLTVGRLTTGVNIPAWTAVMMLSNTSSPSTYLQTAFRVQTPAKIGGKMKTNCYVFDFAPDRTLKMVAQAARLNTRAGKINSSDQKENMARFLNYCSIISLDDSKMGEIDVNHMLRQLKKAAIDKVVSHGFDNDALYNDELLRLDDADLNDFQDLKKIVDTSKQSKDTKGVNINKQGFDDEEWEAAEKAEKKPPRQRTPEEQELLDKMKKLREQRKTMISILRGISIRIPMMIFGAEFEPDKEITVHNFTEIVDEVSWKEFMPNGVTKKLFKKFSKYYDEDVFVQAGLKIRAKAQAADAAPTVRERLMKIADIFATFRNPDKETILTPWKVVNRHIADTLGGYVFFDNNFEYPLIETEDARFVDKGNITKIALHSTETTVLEINSKSGLYPLLACYDIYRKRVDVNRATNKHAVFGRKEHFDLWNKTLDENIYVIAKTPMAKTITERTLRGYTKVPTNVINYENIVKDAKNNRGKLLKEINKRLGNKKGVAKMKFDVIIGNPPYQEMDGGARASASAIYPNFVQAAKKMNPKYISMITPSRWYVGGKGLDSYREEMLNDPHLRELHDWLTPEDIFPNTNIRGGVCYFLLDTSYDNSQNLVRVVTHENNSVISDVMRSMRTPGVDIFIRDSMAEKFLYKIHGGEKDKEIKLNDTMMNYVSSAKAFGFRGFFVKDKMFRATKEGLLDPVKCYGLKGAVGYVERSEVLSRLEWIDKWKVFTAESNNIGTELNDDNFNTIIGTPRTICTETFVVIGADLDLDEESAKNLSIYLKTKFARFLLSIAKPSQHGTKLTYRFIPLQDFTESSDIDWSTSFSELDQQLYNKYNLSLDEIQHIESKIKPM